VTQDPRTGSATACSRTCQSKPVLPKRPGGIGPRPSIGKTYVRVFGTAEFGSDAPFAEMPFVVEVWTDEYEKGVEDSDLTFCINHTPVTGNIEVSHDSKDIDFFGCGLHHRVAKAPKEKQFDIWVNIVTPYMPITSDGKEPDLLPFFSEITSAVSKAIRKVTNPSAGGKVHQKDVVLEHLLAVIASVSTNGKFRFNYRQLFYELRPLVRNEIGEVLQLSNYNSIITEYEAEHGEIPGAYHKPRGTIYHPHRKETIPIGTLMVENYERPIWTFNKLVVIEKEGWTEALKDVGWP
jgi:hypothetical protein